MNIFGQKVKLRAITQQDNAMLMEIINDPETEYMLGGSSFPISPEDQICWFQSLPGDHSILRCMIEDQESKNAVGTIILSDIDYRNGTAQVHIKLRPGSARHSGFGTDSIQAIALYGFNELRLNCIYAVINEYNVASIGLFEKCGFVREGILRSRVFKKGRPYDVLSYSILRQEIGL